MGTPFCHGRVDASIIVVRWTKGKVGYWSLQAKPLDLPGPVG
ncbi:MAG: hypothetical protein RX317_02275 [bacterium]|nr:hypothetical protein [bacterium]